MRLAVLCEDAGLKNGVVQDKLWLPGLPQDRHAARSSASSAEILSVRGEFGYWVFTGMDARINPPSGRAGTTARKMAAG